MSKKILIVDDNKTIRTLLKMNLSQEDFVVIEAENGAEGFEIVNQEKPDLIISDILMPQMDGFEFCRHVRESSSIPTVPFIFLTSIDQVATEVRGYRTGADDYLVKANLKREILIEKVIMMLERSAEYKEIEENINVNEGLFGKLSDLSLIEVVQLLGMNKKNGELIIQRNDEEAYIYFNDGQIHHAKYGNYTGEEAIYQLIDWQDGVFKFKQSDIDIAQNVSNSTMNIIMEYCRILDEKLGTSNLS